MNEFDYVVELSIQGRNTLLSESKSWIEHSRMAPTLKARNACMEIAKAMEAAADGFLSLIESVKEIE